MRVVPANMDRNSYEKLSISESARSLKKYGSTSKHVTRNESYVKHYVGHTDTLQGIALKYDVTVSGCCLWSGKNGVMLCKTCILSVDRANKESE